MVAKLTISGLYSSKITSHLSNEKNIYCIFGKGLLNFMIKKMEEQKQIIIKIIK